MARALTSAGTGGPPRLRLDERVDERGQAVTTSLEVGDGGEIVVRVGEGVVGVLSVDTLARVMSRYGRPLAEGVAPQGDTLHLGGGAVLQHLRHRAHYDVLARDFVVFTRPGHEALCELATSVAGALTHLAEATARASGGDAPP